ncbi:MAG: hypothetical protein JWR05_1978 [Mucilaginibacter sp.]|nr:hypothetical protein [Mucilaginibacter sp.]
MHCYLRASFKLFISATLTSRFCGVICKRQYIKNNKDQNEG